MRSFATGRDVTSERHMQKQMGVKRNAILLYVAKKKKNHQKNMQYIADTMLEEIFGRGSSRENWPMASCT